MKILLLVVLAAGVLYQVVGRLPHERTPSAVAWRTTFDHAAREAQASGKVIFADFYADWCGPCRAMDRNVFSRQEFAASLEQIAVPLRVDLETQPGAALASRYDIEVIPTYIVLRPDGRAIGRGDSGTSADSLLDLVRRASEQAKRSATQ